MRIPISEDELGLVITSRNGEQAYFLPINSSAFDGFYCRYRRNYLQCTYVEFKKIVPYLFRCKLSRKMKLLITGSRKCVESDYNKFEEFLNNLIVEKDLEIIEMIHGAVRIENPYCNQFFQD